MYQSGEVQYLVATDAIGMGLNLDLNHVAFAALSKFDGAEQRDLFPDELAQIAGRAGRHLNDGSFGTLNTLSELPPRVSSAIESHRFPAVRSLIWRNATLDFSSPEALLDSLSRAPHHSAFIRVERADDFDGLKDLSRVPAIRDVATDRATVELLWQVCQVPDFRKGLFGQHVALLRETFLQLTAGSRWPGWFAGRTGALRCWRSRSRRSGPEARGSGSSGACWRWRGTSSPRPWEAFPRRPSPERGAPRRCVASPTVWPRGWG
jgi:ATP-dependent RNA helicase SUPV3L1/SUV3